MEKNATIRATLRDILDVWDARANVQVFVEETSKGNHTPIIISDSVYKILTNVPFMKTYGKKKVIGISLGICHNILISEEEG